MRTMNNAKVVNNEEVKSERRRVTLAPQKEFDFEFVAGEFKGCKGNFLSSTNTNGSTVDVEIHLADGEVVESIGVEKEYFNRIINNLKYIDLGIEEKETTFIFRGSKIAELEGKRAIKVAESRDEDDKLLIQLKVFLDDGSTKLTGFVKYSSFKKISYKELKPGQVTCSKCKHNAVTEDNMNFIQKNLDKGLLGSIVEKQVVADTCIACQFIYINGERTKLSNYIVRVNVTERISNAAGLTMTNEDMTKFTKEYCSNEKCVVQLTEMEVENTKRLNKAPLCGHCLGSVISSKKNSKTSENKTFQKKRLVE